MLLVISMERLERQITVLQWISGVNMTVAVCLYMTAGVLFIHYRMYRVILWDVRNRMLRGRLRFLLTCAAGITAGILYGSISVRAAESYSPKIHVRRSQQSVTRKEYPGKMFCSGKMELVIQVETENEAEKDEEMSDETDDQILIEIVNSKTGKTTEQYDRDDFDRKTETTVWGDLESIHNTYEKKVVLDCEEGSTQQLAVRLCATDSIGQKAQADQRSLDFGHMDHGVYYTDTFVIDREAPVYQGAFTIGDAKPVCQDGDTACYDKAVRGDFILKDAWFVPENVKITAIPVDNSAKETVRNSRNHSTAGIVITEYQQEKRKEDRYRIWFTFSENGRWMFQAEYEDLTGRKCMTDKGDSWINSERVLIDTESPRLILHCESPAYHSEDKIIYQNKSTDWVLEIQEDNMDEEDMSIQILQSDIREVSVKNVTQQCCPQDSWEAVTKGWKLRISLRGEGRYEILFRCQDMVGHRMEAQSNLSAGTVKEGTYVSPTIVLDKTKPDIRAEYSSSPRYTKNHIDYFSKSPIITVRVKEDEIIPGNISVRISRGSADGTANRKESEAQLRWEKEYEDGHMIFQSVLTLKKEGTYLITICGKDLAGNGSGKLIKKIVYDRTPPVTGCSRTKNSDILFENTVPDRLYQSFCWFAKKNLTAEVKVRDSSSGVRMIRWQYVSENGTEIAAEQIERDHFGEVFQEDLGCLTGKCPLKKNLFRGTLRITAEDYCGNVSAQTVTDGIIQESEEEHIKYASLSQSVSDPDYVDKETGIRYYRKPVTISVKGKDSWSGIRTLTVRAGMKLDQKPGKVYQWSAKDEKDIIYEKKLECTIDPEACRTSDASHVVQVQTVLTDNTGNQTQATTDDIPMVLDVTAPEISVDYDGKEAVGGMYYKENRKAVVKVTDRNFNPIRSRVTVTGPKTGYDISEWEGGEGEYRCTVTFTGEGENYRILCTAWDYAGNSTLWDKDQPFTIYRGTPVLAITMDRSGVSHEKYYRTSRKVTFTVTDRYFNSERVVYHMIRNDGKKKETVIPEGDFHSEADQWSKTVVFAEEGEYTVSFEYSDIEGNTPQSSGKLSFVIDRTSPVLSGSGFKSGQIYTGQVRPGAVIKDRNLDTDSVQYCLFRSDGKQWDQEGTYCSITKGKDTVRAVWRHLRESENMDGIYTITVKGEDYAGNSAEQNMLTFALNRYGARFRLLGTFRNHPEKVQKGAWHQDKPEIGFDVWSVTSARLQVILLRDRSHREELTEGKDYTVSERSLSAGRYCGWKKKQVQLSPEIFEKEGNYQITVYAREYEWSGRQKRLVQEVSSDLRGMPVSIRVDRTPPVVQIRGLEDKIYQRKKQEYIISAMDNMELKSVDVTVRKEGRQGGEKIIHLDAEDFDEDHNAKLSLSEYNGYQELSFVAKDSAGNRITSDECGETRRCIVHPSSVVRASYRWESAVAAGLLAILAALIMTAVSSVRKNTPRKRV